MHAYYDSVVTAMGTNFAHHGITKASSFVENGDPQHAVDGKPDGDFGHGSCTLSTGEHEPWWRVYFTKWILVREVVITNRADCCGK